MDNDQKATKVFDAAKQLADEYTAGGEKQTAALIVAAFADLPRDSAARLFDILKAA